MRQGCKVTAGAHGALAGDHRIDPGLQEVQQQLHDLKPHAGVTLCQSVCPDEQGRADDLLLQRLTYAGGVAEDQVPLQLPAVVGADKVILQGAEAGGDAVDALPALKEALHDAAGGHHPFPGLIRQCEAKFRLAGSPHDVVDGKALTADANSGQLCLP